MDALRIDDLRARIDAALTKGPVALLDALCARAVLERLGAEAAAVVYVKRVSKVGVAHPAEMFWAEEGEVLERCYHSDLDREVLQYHERYKPSLTADICFLRTHSV